MGKLARMALFVAGAVALALLMLWVAAWFLGPPPLGMLMGGTGT